MEQISKAIVDGSLGAIADKMRGLEETGAERDARLIAKTIVAAGSITPNRATRRAIAARERKVRSRGKVGA